MKKQKNAPQILPREEWPYEVPENWVWTRLEYIAQWGSGGTPSRKQPQYFQGSIPWIKTGELNDSYIYDAEEKITQEALEKSSAKIFPIHSVMLAMYGATIGKTGILEIPAASNQACACAIPIEGIDYKILFYFLRSQKDYFIANAQGGAQPNISQTIIKQHFFPIPPLPEQQRIVARIESLFAKLDTAAEKIRAALDQFPIRKAAILHKAFTGELTKKWREENGVGMESWKKLSIEALCSLIVDCPHSTPEWTEIGKLCLRTTNIKDGFLDFTVKQYVSEQTFNERNKRAVPQSGDVLLTREGSIGDVGIIPPNVELCLGQRMMLLRPKNCMPEFLVYFFRNPQIMEAIKSQTMGSTAPRMNIKALKQLSLNCPALEEQKYIVFVLRSIFAKEQATKENAERLLEQIALTKKSILARAFRGLLGTNDPKEESAEGWLRGEPA